MYVCMYVIVFTYLKSRSRYAGKTDMKLSNSLDINIFSHILQTNIYTIRYVRLSLMW